MPPTIPPLSRDDMARSLVARYVPILDAMVKAPSRVSGYAINAPSSSRPRRDQSGGSSWSHAHGRDLELIRAQCRSIVRDDCTARALVKMHQAMVVGDGAVVRSTTSNAQWNLECDRLFSAWADGYGDGEDLGHPDVEGRKNLWQICQAVVRAWDTDGDILVIKLGSAAGPDSGRLQLVEADRVASPITASSFLWAAGNTAPIAKPEGAGSTVLDGVERSLRGRPLRYHVLNWTGLGRYTGGQATKIDAKDAWLLVNPSDDAAGMVRGEPGLQAAVPRLERLNKYSENHAVVALIATLFGLVISGPNSQSLQEGLQATEADQPASGPGAMKLETASVISTDPGSSITQIKPEAPHTSFKEYVSFEVMLACADLGIPLCFALLDATQISYIAARAMGAISMRRLAAQQAEVANFVRAVRQWKVREWMDSGVLPKSKDFTRCEVHLPQAPVFDPGAEVAAYLSAIEGRVMTYEQATQSLGSGRATEVHAQLAREIEHLRTLSIEPANKPGAKTPTESGRPASTPAQSPAAAGSRPA